MLVTCKTFKVRDSVSGLVCLVLCLLGPNTWGMSLYCHLNMKCLSAQMTNSHCVCQSEGIWSVKTTGISAEISSANECKFRQQMALSCGQRPSKVSKKSIHCQLSHICSTPEYIRWASLIILKTKNLWTECFVLFPCQATLTL